MAGDGLEHGWKRLSIHDPPTLPNSLDNSRHGSLASDGPILHVGRPTDMEAGGLRIRQQKPSIDMSDSWMEGTGNPETTLLSPVQQEEQGRLRTRSISFHPDARLEDGQVHSLDRPLPRTASLKSVSTADHRPNSTRRKVAPAAFDPDVIRTNPFTGEPIERRTRRQGSTSMSAMNALAETNFASLTSGTTASPSRDEITTPISPVGSYISSPNPDSNPPLSPSTESDAWSAFRPGSVRSARTMPPSRAISLRRERGQTRSGSNSFSPASAFLSKWGRESMASVAPDPDDEGQSFGVGNEYVIGRQIGYGGFSVVKEAFSINERGEKQKHAVKIVRKNIREKGDADNERCQQEVEHEVGIWKYLSHENILSLHAVYDTEFATFCVMDLNEGGSLYDLVREQRKSAERALPAATAKSYAFQLACALRYLHQDVRVVHRDVKMENCLIDRDRAVLGDKPGRLRLCDFGLADFISSDSPEANPCPGNAANVVGSLDYAAPEAMKTEAAVLTPTVDIWAYGVCVYTLVTLDRPFKHSMASKLVDLISRATWDTHAVRESPAALNHHREILTLLRGCLNPDANKRWTISQVLHSPWFADCDDPFATML